MINLLEQNTIYGEWVFVDPSCRYPNSQNILLRWNVLLAEDALHIIQVAKKDNKKINSYSRVIMGN